MKSSRVVSTTGRGIRTLGSSRIPNLPLVQTYSYSGVARTNHTSTVATTSSECKATSAYLSSRNQPRNLFQAQAQKNRRLYSSSSSSSSSGPLNKTALYDLHLSHGAKMVPFGGFEMPVQYSGLSVSASHHFTREKASLFDVGHMVQHRFEGPGATAFLQRITPGSLASLPTHQSTLSALLWPGTGGIVDDTVITRLGPELFYVVTNAACREKDLGYLNEQLAAWDPRNCLPRSSRTLPRRTCASFISANLASPR
jgi:hypothetical protein